MGEGHIAGYLAPVSQGFVGRGDEAADCTVALATTLLACCLCCPLAHGTSLPHPAISAPSVTLTLHLQGETPQMDLFEDFSLEVQSKGNRQSLQFHSLLQRLSDRNRAHCSVQRRLALSDRRQASIDAILLGPSPAPGPS